MKEILKKNQNGTPIWEMLGIDHDDVMYGKYVVLMEIFRCEMTGPEMLNYKELLKSRFLDFFDENGIIRDDDKGFIVDENNIFGVMIYLAIAERQEFHLPEKFQMEWDLDEYEKRTGRSYSVQMIKRFGGE